MICGFDFGFNFFVVIVLWFVGCWVICIVMCLFGKVVCCSGKVDLILIDYLIFVVGVLLMILLIFVIL